jgi:hypothetical protein
MPSAINMLMGLEASLARQIKRQMDAEPANGWHEADNRWSSP